MRRAIPLPRLNPDRVSLATMQRLVKADPANADWQGDLWTAYNMVGDAEYAQGNLPNALANFREALAIAQSLNKLDPTNAIRQRNVAVSDNEVGDVELDQGNRDEALASYRDGAAIVERLATADPKNTGWQRDVSVANGKVASALIDQGRPCRSTRQIAGRARNHRTFGAVRLRQRRLAA